MWKCAICSKENQDSDLICQCGFDRSIDYENFRAFVKLDIQDFQKHQKMQDSVRSNRKLEKEETKDVAGKEQNEESKDLVEKEQSGESKHLIENELEENLPADTESVLLKKTIFPKTKLDWLIYGIGIVMVYGFLCDDSLPMLRYFTRGSLCEPIGDIFYFISDGFLKYFVLTICYIVMNKSLGAIQYNRKKIQIILYAIFSILPLCYVGDIVWGHIVSSMSYRQQYYIVIAHREILSISWFILYGSILLFAFVEKPKKVMTKKKTRIENAKVRGISILPQTKLQTLVFIMGIALVVMIPIGDVPGGTTILALVSWNLLYWLGKILRNVSKYLKAFMYAVCSILPLCYLAVVIGLMELVVGSIFIFLIWVFMIFMALKEGPTTQN